MHCANAYLLFFLQDEVNIYGATRFYYSKHRAKEYFMKGAEILDKLLVTSRAGARCAVVICYASLLLALLLLKGQSIK